jgi:lipid II:glycine glycyltransferase (peptidoglycan interpeptide bridge formation enzyme)
MEIPWASTLRSYNHTSINMIMYWKILEFAVQQGFEVFDFGRCSEDAGTYRFKQQWGAEPVKLYWDYLLPEGENLPKLNPNNPKFRVLIAVWQRLPVWLANLIAPRIVKALP